MEMDKGITAIFGVSGTFLVIGLSALAGWLTHIAVAISALVGDGPVALGYGILLAVGAFMPPVGVVHGWGIWFGFW